MALEINKNLSLEERKNNLLERLHRYDINQKITSLAYLDCSNVDFQSPVATGKRIMIFYAVAYVAHHPEERAFIIQWMKREHLWEEVSAEEQEFFKGIKDTYEDRIRLSWRIEAAHILAWCVNLVDEQPEPHDMCDVEQLAEVLPEIGASLSKFLENLHYRSKTEIFDECLFNELLSAYFSDLLLAGTDDPSGLDAGVIYERHYALSWLRGQSEGMSEL